MLSAFLLLALAVPPAATAPTADAATTSTAASELRPVARIDRPRTRTQAQPVAAIENASPELREPFAKTRAPIAAAPHAAAPLREPFTATPRAHATPRAPAPSAAADRTTLREPW